LARAHRAELHSRRQSILYLLDICSACHQTKYEAVPANGHKWDSGKVTKAAGCETVGEMTYTCSVCSAKRTEAIAATGHSYANGKCTRCGAADPNYIAAPALKITTSAGKPKLTWKAVTGADKYYVYRSTDGKNFSYWDSTTKTTYINSGAKKNTKYYYKVKAVCASNSNANSAQSSAVSIKATK
jgi:hypothetical protein